MSRNVIRQDGLCRAFYNDVRLEPCFRSSAHGVSGDRIQYYDGTLPEAKRSLPLISAAEEKRIETSMVGFPGLTTAFIKHSGFSKTKGATAPR